MNQNNYVLNTFILNRNIKINRCDSTITFNYFWLSNYYLLSMPSYNKHTALRSHL